MEGSELRTARVLPRYRRHRKPRRQQRVDGSANTNPRHKSNTSTADEASGNDENVPHETKPLLIVNVTSPSDGSGDSPSTSFDVVDRAAKLNGSPANVAVSVEEAAVKSTRVWTKWKKLQDGLAIKRRVTERLASSEWWRSRRRRRFGGNIAEPPTALPHKGNSLDHKSFPDNENLFTHTYTNART